MAQKPRKVRFSVSSEFGNSYRGFLKLNPDIKDRLTEFNTAKRQIPPARLTELFEDHALAGTLDGMRECHLAHDILLLYTHENDLVRLILVCNHDAMSGKKAKRLKNKVRRLRK
jgi:addiction module RelE/StbE family toxin